MTPAQLLELRAMADGFRGTFEFKAERVDAEDFVVAEDALVYCTEDQDDYEIASPIEEHIGEPIAKMLNAVPALLDRVAELEAGLRAWAIASAGRLGQRRRLLSRQVPRPRATAALAALVTK